MNIGLFSENNTIKADFFMEIHKNWRMIKVPVAKISSAGFICMTLNSKLYQVVPYITDDKSWKSCHVLLKNLFLCLRVLFLTERNLARMERYIM